MTNIPAKQAHRGDIAVIPVRRTTTFAGSGSATTTEYHVTVVTSVTRDGLVKAVQDVGSETPIPLARFRSVWDQLPITIASKSECDVPGVIATARAHTWDGHPNQVQAYGSWEEVRDMIRSFRL